AKLVAVLPNKVGLDKEYASIDTQSNKADVDAKDSTKGNVQNNATADDLDNKDSLTAPSSKPEKAKK
ncbi:MAG: 5-(carboxyamino)imidazole ribonucleotide synthase, partial [Psychrobacter sp.]